MLACIAGMKQVQAGGEHITEPGVLLRPQAFTSGTATLIAWTRLAEAPVCVCSTKQLANLLGHAARLGYARRNQSVVLRSFSRCVAAATSLEAPHLMRLLQAAAARHDVPKSEMQVWLAVPKKLLAMSLSASLLALAAAIPESFCSVLAGLPASC